MHFREILLLGSRHVGRPACDQSVGLELSDDDRESICVGCACDKSLSACAVPSS